MKKHNYLIIAALFAVSGAVSLSFEVLWVRMLSLEVGSTSASISLVLSVFFLGLAGGSYLGGRFSSRIKRPILAYGAIEALAGMSGLAVSRAIPHFGYVLNSTSSLLGATGAGLWCLRFILTGLLLIIPTALMGSTLPVLCRAANREQNNFSRVIGFLYGVNTLGAVAGAILASFVLIPSLGIKQATIISGVSGMIIFAAAVCLQIFAARLGLSEDIQQNDCPPNAESKMRATQPLTHNDYILLGICMICGFASIAAQVVWNKYLSIFMGSNIFGIGITIAIFLLGIAVGSLMFARHAHKVKCTSALVFWLITSVAIAIVGTTYVLDWLPRASLVLAGTIGEVMPLLFVKSIAAAIAIFPPTAIFGAVFPLCISALKGQSEAPARQVGIAYAVNTIGAIGGSALTGLVVIPVLGSETAIEIATALLLAGALVIAAFGRFRRHNGIYMTIATVLSAALMLSTKSMLSFENIIRTAYFQDSASTSELSATLKDSARSGEQFIRVFEGENSVISLSHDPRDGEEYKKFIRLKTNGLNESVYNTQNLSSLPKYEALLGFIPYAFHATPKNAFVVGFGGGFTVDLLTTLPIPKVQVAEFEPSILEAAKIARGNSDELFHRKNLSIEYEDARYVLAANSGQRFDLIMSQPSHSWLMGAANLFTRDFFEIVSNNLNRTGIYSQWLNLYNMDLGSLQSIVGTFFKVFPYGYILSDYDDNELILVGGNAPLVMNTRRVDAILTDPKISAKVKHLPLNDSSDIIASILLDRESALAFSASAEENTDDNALAEIRQSRMFYKKYAEITDLQNKMLEYYSPQSIIASVAKSPDNAAWDSVLAKLSASQQFAKLNRAITQYEGYLGAPSYSLSLGKAAIRAERFETGRRNIEGSWRKNKSLQDLEALADLYFQTGREREFLQELERHKNLRSPIIDCYESVGGSMANSYHHIAAGMKIAASFAAYERTCGIYANKAAGLALTASGRYTDAIPYLQAYIQGYSDDLDVVYAMLQCQINVKHNKAVAGYGPMYTRLLEKRRAHFESLGNSYISTGALADGNYLLKLAGALPANSTVTEPISSL